MPGWHGTRTSPRPRFPPGLGCWPTERARGEPRVPPAVAVLARDRPDVVQAIVEAVGREGRRAAANREEVARLLAAELGLEAGTLRRTLGRKSFGVSPMDVAVVAEQQDLADVFAALGLIPGKMVVRDAVVDIGPAASGQRDLSIIMNVFWFFPTSGDGRYLGTTRAPARSRPATCARSPGRSTSSATTAHCCRPARLRGRLGDRLDARAGHPAAASSWSRSGRG